MYISDLSGNNGANTILLTKQRAVIDHASSGNNTIVAGINGRKIRVVDFALVAAGEVLARFESGADGTSLTDQMALVTNSGVAAGYNKNGHFQTERGELLNLELSASVSVDGWVDYEIV